MNHLTQRLFQIFHPNQADHLIAKLNYRRDRTLRYSGAIFWLETETAKLLLRSISG